MQLGSRSGVNICAVFCFDAWQDHDFVEICAGFGRLSRVMNFAGYSVEALDIKYWSPWKSAFGKLPPDIGNPLDMCTDAGMACLGWPVIVCLQHVLFG